MKPTIRAARTAALAIALIACSADRLTGPAVVSGTGANADVVLPEVRISEFHYNNVGTDQGERIEISGPAGTNLAGWQIVRYNGAVSTAAVVYTSPAGPTVTGTIPNQCDGRGTLVFSYPQDGLQNGGNDGFALVNPSNVVIELLSYQGTFRASNGPASGMTSVDVGVSQTGDATLDPVGASIQRDGNGVWKRTAANTFGSCNDNQTTPPAVVASVDVTPNPSAATVGNTTTLTATARDAGGQPINGTTFTWTTDKPSVATVSSSGVVTGVSVGTAKITATAPNSVAGFSNVTVSMPAGAANNVRVSEFHYDNTGTDVDEKIELEGDAGGSVDGWKLVLYSGTPTSATVGQSYATINLTGTFGNACVEGTRGVLTFAAPGLQNGDNDGFALVDASGNVVEFLSYEGSFQAVNGPAAGMTATDVGVSEANAPAIGRSLQRARNGVWFGPYPSTFDACNSDTPPPPVTGITFTGRVPSDPALPVGFQDQIFANLKDENTGATVPTTFTWVSETPSIATIDARGVITALAAGSATFRATAANGVTNTTTLPTEVAPLGDQSLYRDPLEAGTPADGTPFDELRVTRPQYTLSYNQALGRPNWAAYHLSRTVRGDLPGYRCDCFTADPAVSTLEFPGISTADYTGSGFDRGHMVRSNDRELARGEQATTYYMANIVPQTAALNQHRWAAFESYLQTVADGAGSPEVYIVTGPRGNAGSIANGRVAVPTATWKVALVLPAGTTPSQVHTRADIIDVIAVDMPNTTSLPQDTQWQLHKTTVDAVEALSGYDLLSALPDPLEAIIESGDHEPTAAFTAPASANEGASVTFDASASSDPDEGDLLSYSWTFSNGATSTLVAPSVVFGDDGSYTAKLVVTDRFGATSELTKNITIANVAPTIATFAGASLNQGGTYAATGSFSDPGTDSFTATVDYGDGTGTHPLALDGRSFTLSHPYANGGTFTVTVTVTDDDGGSSISTATVHVNHTPVPVIGGALGGTEGSTLSLIGSGSSDADAGDVLTYEWSFSNGATSSQANPSVAFGDNGAYTATLTVTDNHGASATTSETITITNVAPTVAAFAGATILRGETFAGAGGFADPGPDSWTATVNYGDGSGAQPLALSGTSFSLSHAYATAGTFTVTVTVSDDDSGVGSRTATVTVLSASDAIDILSGNVAGLGLSTGETRSLQASLDAAAQSLAKGNTTPARNQLGAFINKVEAMRASGRLSAATAQALIDYANRTIASIG